MLILLPFVMALAAAPAATPSEAPTPTPLTEIGHVRSTPICTPIVVHANGAITSALDNDRSLAILATNLRAMDFDRLNVLQRQHTIDDLMKQAGEIRQNGKLADDEIKQLRAYAAASTDPERKAELKRFADALGGAIYRQTKAAAEVMRDVTIVEGRDEAQDARDLMAANNPQPNVLSSQLASPAPILPGHTKSYNEMMRGIADSLTELNRGIIYDEGVAADHSIAATAGC
jgi:hypothetical protein